MLGLLLVAAGLLILLSNIGLVSGLMWTALLLAGAGTFLSIYARDHERWWALIPAFALLGLGGVANLDLLPASAADWGGTIFLGALGLGFAAAWLTDRARWWAIIPAGTLITLGVVARPAGSWPNSDQGWLLFLGLALTFGLVYLDPRAAPRRSWALYPAAGLLVIALLIGTSLGPALNLVWPVALMLAGLYLGFRRARLPAAPRAPAPAPLVKISAPGPTPPDDRLQHVERLIDSAVGSAPPAAEPADDAELATAEHQPGAGPLS
jgi:hypothetical protein